MKGLGIASMVLGIVALVFCWIPILSMWLAIIGLTLGVVGLILSIVKHGSKGPAITGVVCCTIALILPFVFASIFFSII